MTEFIEERLRIEGEDVISFRCERGEERGMRG